VRLSSRKSNILSDYAVDASGTATGGCRNLTTNYPTTPGLKGAWRYPFGKNVPTYLLQPDAGDATLCGRYFINADKGNDYATKAAFPAWLYPEEGNRFVPGSDQSAQAGHLGGDTWVADAAIAMMANEDWSGMFVTMGAIDKTAHMFGADADTATPDCSTGEGQVHVKCAAENADVQLGKLLAQVAAVDAAKGGETLVVLTADHGATYGQNFHGKDALLAGDSNWYYAPNGVWDAGAFDTVTYNSPSPAIAAFGATLNGNLQFSYQSTAVEAWLIDRSPAKQQQAAAAALALPGAIASYYRSGSGYKLYGTNTMTKSEDKWWKKHGQEIVDTLASSDGPDTVALLQDKTSYGVYGDHGGAQEAVQRVPMVFWSPSLAFGENTGGPFQTTDVMPTILSTMGIPLTAPVDGQARPLDD